MKELNLVYKEQSSINYRLDSFPDGQQNVTILDKLNKEDILVKSRLNNWKDLEVIIASVTSLRNLGIKEIHLYTPYFLGSRSDRQFEEGSNNYLKQIICPIINSLNLESITVLDGHSDVLEACLDNYKKESNEELVKFALGELYNYDSGNMDNDFVLVSPDGGALKKVYKIADELEFKGSILTCSKSRDTNGRLSKTQVKMYSEYEYKDMIIIDDICDGGRTFINIAKELKLCGHLCNVYLIVSHGIFSAGYEELNKYFDGIYTTNSVKDITDYVQGSSGRDIPTKVKQLNIF